MAISNIAIGVLGLAIAVAVYLSSLKADADPREPRVLQPKIPFFGHLIGMLTEGPLYIKRMSDKCKLPIFTLPMLTGRTYVVASPTLAVSVQRTASTLDFDELIIELTPRMVKSSAETKRILKDSTARAEGRRRMVNKAHDIINPPLSGSAILDTMQTQLNHFSNYINNVKNGEEVDVYKSITRNLTAASMYSFFGPNNPFAVHPELVEKYWDWDDGAIGHIVGVLPQITARKAYYGMEACVKGFVEYLEKGRYEEAVPFLQERKKLHESVGIVGEEHARLEMGMAFAANSNAGITTFWVVNNIFSRPDLLAQIRDEIYNNAFEAPNTISASKLRDACPLLVSAWRETMRLTAPMTSARVVMEDTMLADTYLLRKGSIVQIAGGVLHDDTEIWGPDASSFNPRRFYYSLNGTKSNADGSVIEAKSNAVHPAAFRGFGGGTSLCPGRHFAQMEITTLAAVLVLGFDMQPADGLDRVQWNPPRDDAKIPLAVVKPARAVRAKLTRRQGFEDVEWALKL